MNYEIKTVVITKERKHDGVERSLVGLNTKEEIEELRLYISEMWNKEIKKVSADDRIIVNFTVEDRTKK